MIFDKPIWSNFWRQIFWAAVLYDATLHGGIFLPPYFKRGLFTFIAWKEGTFLYDNYGHHLWTSFMGIIYGYNAN